MRSLNWFNKKISQTYYEQIEDVKKKLITFKIEAYALNLNKTHLKQK